MNLTKERRQWNAVRVLLLGRYYTLKAAAAHYGCNVSAFRFMAAGLCPKLEQQFLADFGLESLEELYQEKAAA